MTKPQAGILIVAALLIGLHSRTAAQQSNAGPQTIAQSGANPLPLDPNTVNVLKANVAARSATRRKARRRDVDSELERSAADIRVEGSSPAGRQVFRGCAGKRRAWQPDQDRRPARQDQSHHSRGQRPLGEQLEQDFRSWLAKLATGNFHCYGPQPKPGRDQPPTGTTTRAWH